MTSIRPADLMLNPDGSVYHLRLLPHHLSETILSVGDPDRVGQVSRHFDDVEFRIQHREFVTHGGWYKGRRLMVMSTGIGTDNVELCLTELDALANIDLTTRLPKPEHTTLHIIRLGTSGSLREDIPLGSLLASRHAVGLDMLMHYYHLPADDLETAVANDLSNRIAFPAAPYVVAGSAALARRFASGMITGNTVTAPGFYAPQGRQGRIVSRYPDLLDQLRAYAHPPSSFVLSNFEMETAGYYGMARVLGHEALSLSAIIANRETGTFSNRPEDVVEELILAVLQGI